MGRPHFLFPRVARLNGVLKLLHLSICLCCFVWSFWAVPCLVCCGQNNLVIPRRYIAWAKVVAMLFCHTPWSSHIILIGNLATPDWTNHSFLRQLTKRYTHEGVTSVAVLICFTVMLSTKIAPWQETCMSSDQRSAPCCWQQSLTGNPCAEY